MSPPTQHKPPATVFCPACRCPIQPHKQAEVAERIVDAGVAAIERALAIIAKETPWTDERPHHEIDAKPPEPPAGVSFQVAHEARVLNRIKADR